MTVLSGRNFLYAGLLATGIFSAFLTSAHAQTNAYPQKPVKVVVAFTAGGTTDILARIVAQQLTEKLKQPFVIDNKPGAGGNLGTELVVRSPADGYTLIVNSVGPMAVNSTLYGKLPYNPLNDGKLNYGSTGVGTSSHLSSFMLAKRAGFNATHVPYKGADALKDLLAGRIQFMFATIPSVMPQIQAGKLRSLAVSSLKRSRSMPDVPTVIEMGMPNFEAGSWFGFFAPKGTPDIVISTVNKAVNEILSSPAIEQQMVVQGADPVGGTALQFGQFVQRETDKWRVIVKESGAKAE